MQQCKFVLGNPSEYGAPALRCHDVPQFITSTKQSRRVRAVSATADDLERSPPRQRRRPPTRIGYTLPELRLIYTLSLESQDQAVALIASPRLQAWLTQPSSSMLLVNGQMFSNDAEALQSPLSYFCARLIDNVLNSSQYGGSSVASQPLGLRWFCGMPTSMKKDDYASPAGILISILSQLIHQIVESPAPVTLTDVSILDKLVREEDLLCMFERLVGVLPAGTVLFCVLDGLSYYEDKKRGKDCMDLLTMLAKLTRRRPETIHGPMV